MNGTPRTLSRDRIVYALDRQTSPALTIDSGETVRFETHDARTGTITSTADLLEQPHPDGSNPATGPVWIRDAHPLDSLAVRILDIQLADTAFVAVKKHAGLLAQRADKFATRVVRVRDGWIDYSPGIRFPVRPMVGVIGTAPSGDAIETAYPGAHGGNMDNRYVTTGATIHLPIFTPGALFALGDVHAAMGDGEITMVGLESAASVTVRIDIAKGVQVSRPWIEHPEGWVTTGDDPDPAVALRVAAEEMARFLQNRLHLSFEDAYMLMSTTCDVQICQACDPGNFPVTARAVYPRQTEQPT
ncbi:TPA: formamidase [Candidatus Latescibacteria bacterium]|nr:formamidase [Candidatus Latescibacterota bacterium]